MKDINPDELYTVYEVDVPDEHMKRTRTSSTMMISMTRTPLYSFWPVWCAPRQVDSEITYTLRENFCPSGNMKQAWLLRGQQAVMDLHRSPHT